MPEKGRGPHGAKPSSGPLRKAGSTLATPRSWPRVAPSEVLPTPCEEDWSLSQRAFLLPFQRLLRIGPLPRKAFLPERQSTGREEEGSQEKGGCGQRGVVERGGEGDGGWGGGSGKPARCCVHFSLSEQLWEVCITIPISQMETEACRGMLTCLTLKMTKYGFKPTKCDSKTPARITQNQKGPGPEMVQKCSGVGRRGHSSRSSPLRETPPHHGLAWHCDLSPSALTTGRGQGRAGVLTSRTGPAGRGRRQVSASGTWASRRQPGQRACNSRPPYSGASRAGRDAEEGYLLPFPPVASPVALEAMEAGAALPTGSRPCHPHPAWRREHASR